MRSAFFLAALMVTFIGVPARAGDEGQVFQPLSSTITNRNVQQWPDADIIRRVTDQIADLVVKSAPSASKQDMLLRLSEILYAEQGGSEEAIARLVRAHLADKVALTHYAGDEKSSPKERPLRNMTLWTKPYATHISGLCRKESLNLWFKPVSAEAATGADTETKVSTLMIIPWYYFLSPPPKAAMAASSPKGHEKDELSCANPASEKRQFTIAYGDDQAVRGTWLIQQLLVGLDKPAPAYTLRCSPNFGSASDCLQSFRTALGSNPQIVRCDPNEDNCRLFSGNTDINVQLTPGPNPNIVAVDLKIVALVQMSQ